MNKPEFEINIESQNINNHLTTRNMQLKWQKKNNNKKNAGL